VADASSKPAIRECEVAIIGAGSAGLCAAMRLRLAGIDDFLVLEKSGGVGGTWRDNSYPGAACDVPSMFYSFSFEVNTEWSRRYAQQPEILDYLERCADKYGVRDRIRCNTEVRQAGFDEASGRWRIETADGEVVSAGILINGTGQLNRPFIPGIPGHAAFRGTSFHSARWDHEHDLRGGRVGVIGNGASAIQFIPEIASEAAELYIFQRSANWIVPRKDRPYTRFESWLFKRLPVVPWLQRLSIWLKLELRWPAFARPGSLVARLSEWASLRHMRKQVADPALHPALTPDYPLGCKRVLISDDYYPTLNRDSVHLVTDPIGRITADGIVTRDGTERELDTIVFATGFRSTEFLAPMRVRGRAGKSLADAWGDGAEAYLGVTLPGFPNFFMLYGPNTNLGHNSIIFMIERQVEYVMQCIGAIRARCLKYLELRPEVMERWRREARTSLGRTVWATSCQSWYKTADGRITNNWPYSTTTYWLRMRHARLDEYHQVGADTGDAPRTPAGGANEAGLA